MVRWAAADDKYFAVAAVPHPEAAPAGTTASASSGAIDRADRAR